jgi:hypothetical protein
MQDKQKLVKSKQQIFKLLQLNTNVKLLNDDQLMARFQESKTH